MSMVLLLCLFLSLFFVVCLFWVVVLPRYSFRQYADVQDVGQSSKTHVQHLSYLQYQSVTLGVIDYGLTCILDGIDSDCKVRGACCF